MRVGQVHEDTDRPIDLAVLDMQGSAVTGRNQPDDANVLARAYPQWPDMRETISRDLQVGWLLMGVTYREPVQGRCRNK